MEIPQGHCDLRSVWTQQENRVDLMEIEVWLKGFRLDFSVYPMYYGLSIKELFWGLVVPANPSIYY